MINISAIPFYETPAVGDLETREILSELVDIAQEEANMLTMLEYTGNMVGTQNKLFHNYTNTFLYDTLTVAASGGATVTEAGVAIDVVAGQGTRVRKGSILMDSERRTFYVSAVSTDSVTVKTLAGSGSTAIANDEVLAIPTNAVGEGGSNGDMAERSIVKRSNQIQIFENGIEVTDLLQAGRTELSLRDGSNYYFYKIQGDAYLKHKTDIANNHLVGQFGTTTDADTGRTIYLSRGLDNSIIDLGGVSLETAAVGTLTKADFATWNRALDLARSPKRGALAVGGDINVLIDDLFDTILADGAVDYGMWGQGSNAAKAADLGIQNFKVYGRTFEKMVLPQLDHVNVTAVTGFEYPDVGYFIPAGSTKGENGGPVPYLRGRYLENGTNYVNGRFHEKLLGGWAPVPTSKENVLQARYTSYEAIEANGTEHMGRFKIQR